MEKEKIHIGNYVKSILNQNGYVLADVARNIGISRQKLNGWLNKPDLHVKDLFTISQATNYDFLKAFCLPEENEQKRKVILHVEIEDEKINDVLKVIKDKQLYNLLKEQKVNKV